MKYDIIVELKSNSLIDKLDLDEQNFLRKILKELCNKPGRIDEDKIKLLDKDSYLIITEGGRKLECKSKDEKTRFEIIIHAGGVFKYRIHKESDDGYRLIEFTTSTKSRKDYNIIDILFYDSEAVNYIEKSKKQEKSEFEKHGIIPDEKERILLPCGQKGTEEIIIYVIKTLENPNNDVIGKLLLENDRISANSKCKVYLSEDGKVQINKQDENISPQKIKK